MILDLQPTDQSIVEAQIGRTPRGMVGVAARCICTNPIVVITAPRVPEPFPTTFYLTSPQIAGAISTLEAGGYMKELQNLITPDCENYDEEIAQKYTAAHEKYIKVRDILAKQLNMEPLTTTHADFSAGGMPNRVKCLHALVGHELATGENPIGKLAIEELKRRGLWEREVCLCKK